MPIPTKSKRASKKRVNVWKLGSEEQNAFDKLKEALATSPKLGYADYTLEIQYRPGFKNSDANGLSEPMTCLLFQMSV